MHFQNYGQKWTQTASPFSSAVLSGKQGGILLVPDAETAYQFINDYAPEHLEILSTDPFKHLDFIRNAGEILLGAHTPVPLGNFVLGANAILPTGAKAQYASPLSVFDYMKTHFGRLRHQAGLSRTRQTRRTPSPLRRLQCPCTGCVRCTSAPAGRFGRSGNSAAKP